MFLIRHYLTMKTLNDLQKALIGREPGIANATAPSSPYPAPSSLTSISPNPTEFHEISSNSTISKTQVHDNQHFDRKSVPGTFAQRISPEQRSILFEWLADHTYDEVVELVAAEPPEGFGIKVGKSTLCRFHKANFYEIDKLRQTHLENRAAESLHRADGEIYREVVRDAYTQLLLERLWELLSRPVQSADELKKLTVIAEKMKSLDRDKEYREQMKAERSEAEIEKIMAAFRSRPTPG